MSAYCGPLAPAQMASLGAAALRAMAWCSSKPGAAGLARRALSSSGAPAAAAAAATAAAAPPIESVLIANRGEIACRVARTARRMGMRVVAVYSDADARAPLLRIADEAVHIGPSPSAESYLRVDKIMGAIEKTGAASVHPGYGFLSENASFVEELERAGVIFVGPPAKAITAMGDKIMSKQIAKEAGVNTIPGYQGEVATAEEAREIAKGIGYPLMIKASAGGGGKGMRIVWNDRELTDAFRDCAAEAASSFGDSRLLMERYIQTSRHIELQVLADAHGNCVWLPERECSVQRRNQKVLEEAPSPFMDDATREKMGEQAVRLCKLIGYRSAGTVEFLVDDEKNFYFLEMNTRLQVEHPITEYVSGFDLVEEMLHIAAGRPLRMTQERARQIHGWALEARIYAERPSKNFLPCTGTLTDYAEPVVEGDAGVRCDSGVEEGSEISIYYDPMVSKLVTHGPTREDALDRMVVALDRYVIRGLEHNIPFCRDLVNLPDFRSGDINTDFIKNNFPDGWTGASLSAEEEGTAAGICAMMRWTADALARAAAGADTRAPQRVVVTTTPLADGAEPTKHEVSIHPGPAAAPGGAAWTARVAVGGRELEIGLPVETCASTTMAVAEVDGAHEYVHILRTRPCGYDVQFRGAEMSVAVCTPEQDALHRYMPVPVVVDKSKLVRTPMPAALVKVLVKPGDRVSPGDEVAIVEAMKMRNVLRSDVEAVVKAVPAQEGDVLPMDGVIAEFE